MGLDNDSTKKIAASILNVKRTKPALTVQIYRCLQAGEAEYGERFFENPDAIIEGIELYLHIFGDHYVLPKGDTGSEISRLYEIVDKLNAIDLEHLMNRFVVGIKGKDALDKVSSLRRRVLEEIVKKSNVDFGVAVRETSKAVIKYCNRNYYRELYMPLAAELQAKAT